jgi:rhodanese-related sulfurtransferase
MPRSTKRSKSSRRRSTPSYRSRGSGGNVRQAAVLVLLVVAVIAIGALIIQAVGDATPWQYAEEISPQDARDQIQSGAIVVDVRPYEEFVAGHISNVLFMPLEELPDLMEALPKDRLIITVCRTGLRSIQARYILQDAGFSQVTSLRGGMEAWLAAGFPVEYGEPLRNN